MQKLFVLDTNVVLFDHTCIYNFREHDVALSIVVLEELDRFKRGNDAIDLEARQFIRELDALAGDGPLTEGLPLGEGCGRLYVEVGDPASPRVSKAFTLAKPDHRILALAEELQKRHPDRQVILVSKDVNLRMKAKSVGLLAEDYTTGKVRHVDRLYSGHGLLGGPRGRDDRTPARRAARAAARGVQRSRAAAAQPVPRDAQRQPVGAGAPQPAPPGRSSAS